jgi:hypothetical protein
MSNEQKIEKRGYIVERVIPSGMVKAVNYSTGHKVMAETMTALLRLTGKKQTT